MFVEVFLEVSWPAAGKLSGTSIGKSNRQIQGLCALRPLIQFGLDPTEREKVHMFLMFRGEHP